MEHDIIEKKEELVKVLEDYLNNKNKEILIKKLEKLKDDEVIKKVELFINIIDEFLKYSDELSNKDIKQRILLIKSYIY